MWNQELETKTPVKQRAKGSCGTSSRKSCGTTSHSLCINTLSPTQQNKDKVQVLLGKNYVSCSTANDLKLLTPCRSQTSCNKLITICNQHYQVYENYLLHAVCIMEFYWQCILGWLTDAATIAIVGYSGYILSHMTIEGI